MTATKCMQTKVMEKQTQMPCDYYRVASINEKQKKTSILISGSEQMHADKMTQQQNVGSLDIQKGWVTMTDSTRTKTVLDCVFFKEEQICVSLCLASVQSGVKLVHSAFLYVLPVPHIWCDRSYQCRVCSCVLTSDVLSNVLHRMNAWNRMFADVERW